MKIRLVQFLESLTLEELSKLQIDISKLENQSIKHMVLNYFVNAMINRESIDNIKSIHKANFRDISYKSFTNALSDAIRLVEDFMVYEEVMYSKDLRDFLLLKSLNRRGAFEQYDAVARKINRQHKSSLDFDRMVFDWLIDDDLYYSNHPAKYRAKGAMIEALTYNLLKVTSHYLALYRTEMVSWSKLRKYDYTETIDHIDNIQNLIDQKSEIKNMLKEVNNMVETLSISAQNKVFQRLQKEGFIKDSRFQLIIAAYLNGYIATIANASERTPKGLIAMYNYLFTTRLFFYNNKISLRQFLIIYSVICYYLSYEEAEDFVAQWKEKVDYKDEVDFINFCKAYNCFYHGRYADILKYTILISRQDESMHLRVYILDLVAYFEGRHIDPDGWYAMRKRFLQHLRILNIRDKKAVQREKNFLMLVDMIDKDDPKFTESFLHTVAPISYKSYFIGKLEKGR